MALVLNCLDSLNGLYIFEDIESLDNLDGFDRIDQFGSLDSVINLQSLESIYSIIVLCHPYHNKQYFQFITLFVRNITALLEGLSKCLPALSTHITAQPSPSPWIVDKVHYIKLKTGHVVASLRRLGCS